MRNGALKVIEEGETEEDFSKRKIFIRKKTLHEENLQEQFVDQEHCTQVFCKVDKEWVFEEGDRGHVICTSGAGTKNQCNQRKIAKQPVLTKCCLYGTPKT